jgi:hypothetical protein
MERANAFFEWAKSVESAVDEVLRGVWVFVWGIGGVEILSN